MAVLLSRSLELPWDAGLFQAPDQPVIVYTDAPHDPPPTKAPLEVVRTADPARALEDLKRRGTDGGSGSDPSGGEGPGDTPEHG